MACPLIHVRDLAKATATILEAFDDVVRGQAFNAGRATQKSISSFVTSPMCCPSSFDAMWRSPMALG